MPMVVNTGVTNRNHTPGLYSAETTAGLPAPGSKYVWVLDKQAGILYVDNGVSLVAILISGGGGAVTSVFGRTGAVTAQAGDYSAFYLPLTAGSGKPLTGILFAPLGINANGNFIVDVGGNIAAIAISVNNATLAALTSTNATINTLLQALAISGIGAGGTLLLQPNTSATAANSFVLDNNGLTHGGGTSVSAAAFLDRQTVVDPASTILSFAAFNIVSFIAGSSNKQVFGVDIGLTIAAASTQNNTGGFFGSQQSVTIANGATGVFSAAIGVFGFISNASAGATITKSIGGMFNALGSAVGVYTNAVHLLLGVSSVSAAPTGKWSIYYGGALSNILGTGRTVIGAITDNGVDALQVTGTVTTNGNTITGKTEAPGTNTTAMASTEFVQAAIGGVLAFADVVTQTTPQLIVGYLPLVPTVVNIGGYVIINAIVAATFNLSLTYTNTEGNAVTVNLFAVGITAIGTYSFNMIQVRSQATISVSSTIVGTSCNYDCGVTFQFVR